LKAGTSRQRRLPGLILQIFRRENWLYERRLIRKVTSATFAAGGVGKSILVLTEVLAMMYAGGGSLILPL
jgi:hypothetical protein